MSLFGFYRHELSDLYLYCIINPGGTCCTVGCFELRRQCNEAKMRRRRGVVFKAAACSGTTGMERAGGHH